MLLNKLTPLLIIKSAFNAKQFIGGKRKLTKTTCHLVKMITIQIASSSSRTTIKNQLKGKLSRKLIFARIG